MAMTHDSRLTSTSHPTTLVSGVVYRVALGIIEEAERSGALGPGGTIVEGTAGSTGISLALLARARGYKCSIYMPDDMATEKSDTLRLLGAEVVRLPAVSIVNSEHYCKVRALLQHSVVHTQPTNTGPPRC
jgi:cysteine synthase A